ncbi:MAG: hypothetical protein KUG75_08960 [Pseudomonadales bacterium]|nr:hypothetical protein [Pseudomonadales bacterium]
MTAILSMFWNICRLKRGPQYVPSQALFLVALIIGSLLVSTFLNLKLVESESSLKVFTLIVTDLAVTSSLVWSALYFKNVGNRFPQTLSAMVGCDLLLTLLVTILILLIGNTSDPKDPLTIGIVVLYQIWLISIWGFILHHALGITVMQGVFLVIAIAFFSFIFSGSLATATA